MKTEFEGMTIGASASFLGVHEFSLLSRIQNGEIEMIRARSGEVLIPKEEVERLAAASVATLPVSYNTTGFTDDNLGIEGRHRGLRRNGESASFRVPDYRGSFTAREIDGYRTAFSAIATQLGIAKELNEQLSHIEERELRGEAGLPHRDIGEWAIRAELLKLDRGDVVLCERENEFAVIERFPNGSRYAQTKGSAEILLQGNDVKKLSEDFRANAQLTLEFMASNLAAKAQKIVWEQFPDERPGHVVAAISERCRRAISNEQTISEGHAAGEQHNLKRGIRI
jgi:hypothetical protein